MVKQEVALNLFIEPNRIRRGRRNYLYTIPQGQTENPIPKAVDVLDQACESCLLKPVCLPDREVTDNGRTLVLAGSETTNPNCGINPKGRNRIILDLSRPRDVSIPRSPMAKILG